MIYCIKQNYNSTTKGEKMYQPEAKVVPVDPSERPPLTIADMLIDNLKRRSKDILKDKASALAYLKSIGITVDKNGKTKVTPL